MNRALREGAQRLTPNQPVKMSVSIEIESKVEAVFLVQLSCENLMTEALIFLDQEGAAEPVSRGVEEGGPSWAYAGREGEPRPKGRRTDDSKGRKERRTGVDLCNAARRRFALARQSLQLEGSCFTWLAFLLR